MTRQSGSAQAHTTWSSSAKTKISRSLPVFRAGLASWFGCGSAIAGSRCCWRLFEFNSLVSCRNLKPGARSSNSADWAGYGSRGRGAGKVRAGWNKGACPLEGRGRMVPSGRPGLEVGSALGLCFGSHALPCCYGGLLLIQPVELAASRNRVRDRVLEADDSRHVRSGRP